MRTAVVAVLLAVPAGFAEAHIHLLEPLSRTDNALGDPQKNEHCGDPAVTRIDTRVTTFKPGETITVKWAETVDHTGYYRIAFQADGEVFRIPPAVNGTGFPTEDLTGMVDPGGTGSIILKDQIPDTTLQTTVTLPLTVCNTCTLQLIQVMTDSPTYEPINDIYFNCADITLSAEVPDPGDEPDAGVGGGGDDGSGSGSGELSGGCSSGNATGLGALVLVGLAGLRRRRAR